MAFKDLKEGRFADRGSYPCVAVSLNPSCPAMITFLRSSQGRNPHRAFSREESVGGLSWSISAIHSISAIATRCGGVSLIPAGLTDRSLTYPLCFPCIPFSFVLSVLRSLLLCITCFFLLTCYGVFHLLRSCPLVCPAVFFSTTANSSWSSGMCVNGSALARFWCVALPMCACQWSIVGLWPHKWHVSHQAVFTP